MIAISITKIYHTIKLKMAVIMKRCVHDYHIELILRELKISN